MAVSQYIFGRYTSVFYTWTMWISLWSKRRLC